MESPSPPMADEDDFYYSDMSVEDEDENEDADAEEVYGHLPEEDDCSVHFQSSVPTVITRESLLAAQKEDLVKVMELLGVKEQHARTLLMYHRWHVDRIFDLLERKGMERLFLEAGVTITDDAGPAAPPPEGAVVTCEVCFEDFPVGGVTVMDCGHCFCNDCWTEHFVVKINDGQSRRIMCMAPKCKAICDEEIVKRLVSERYPDLAGRFDRFLLESYIEDNDKVKWCPSVPHCGNAIRIDGDKYCEVECTCGLQFCFSCLAEAHSPCSCPIWDLWAKKCHNESANVNWITAHTKHCPKCHKPVDKNGGCNLVRCICGQPFCWLCGDATGVDHTWDSISGHSCNRFKDEKQKVAENAKRNLDRYIHYHDRYKAHCDSLKLEGKLKETMLGKINIAESKDSIHKDYFWVMEALDRLFKSRRVLSYTYPFAFYMFGDELFENEALPEDMPMKKILFEAQQEHLESNVEKLSMILEKGFEEFTDEEVSNMRREIICLSKAVDTSCRQMYQNIEDDLLGSIKTCVHNVAPYTSVGLQKASEISVPSEFDLNLSSCRTSTSSSNDSGVRQDANAKGVDISSSASEDGSSAAAKQTLRGTVKSFFGFR